MSDSDDDDYDNSLESRRAALQKKRQPTKVYQSDSDDDFITEKLPVIKKKRDPVGDSDDESILETPESHDNHTKHRIEDVEEEYRKKIFSKKDGVVHVANERHDALGKAMRLIESMQDSDSPGRNKSRNNGKDEADTSIGGDLPVTISLVDCESKINSTGIRCERNVPLDSTFIDIRKELALKWSCRLDEVILSYKGNTIANVQTPQDLGMQPLLYPRPQIDATKDEKEAPTVFTVEGSPDFNTVTVRFKDAKKKECHVAVSNETTMQEIMQKAIDELIERGEKGVPSVDKMRAMTCDGYCEKSQTCEELEISDGDIIDIHVQA